jgi:hypothetical protein
MSEKEDVPDRTYAVRDTYEKSLYVRGKEEAENVVSEF